MTSNTASRDGCAGCDRRLSAEPVVVGFLDGRNPVWIPDVYGEGRRIARPIASVLSEPFHAPHPTSLIPTDKSERKSARILSNAICPKVLSGNSISGYQRRLAFLFPLPGPSFAFGKVPCFRNIATIANGNRQRRLWPIFDSSCGLGSFLIETSPARMPRHRSARSAAWNHFSRKFWRQFSIEVPDGQWNWLSFRCDRLAAFLRTSPAGRRPEASCVQGLVVVRRYRFICRHSCTWLPHWIGPVDSVPGTLSPEGTTQRPTL